MHISIPEYTNFKDNSQSVYIVYHIHINGLFHSRIRFKQLHSLHEELRKRFPRTVLPFFPRKKLFSLDIFEVEQRRQQLEHYLQQLCQDEQIVNNTFFVNYFLSSQQNTLNSSNETNQLQVWLENDTSVSITIDSNDSLQTVKQKISNHLQLSSSLSNLFELFMFQLSSDTVQNKTRPNQFNSIRRQISHLESPWLTLSIAKKGETAYGVLWHRFYWNKDNDYLLLGNECGTRLLCSSINRFVKQNSNCISNEQLKQLETFKVWKDKRDLIKFVHQLPFYGYWTFKECLTNYPSDSSKVDVLLGDREICFKTHSSSNSESFKFAINRVRSWRLTTSFKGSNHSESTRLSNCKSRFISSSFEFAFEYLLPCGKLKWISLKSDQLIVMASCLHQIVRELLRKHKIERNEQNRKEIHFDFSKRICNYWRKSSSDRIDDQLQLTKSNSIDTFYRPKTMLAETSFSSENKLFTEAVKEDQSHI